MRKTVAVAIFATVLAAGAAHAAAPPSTWDDLVLTPKTKLGAVYILPGASFGKYHKVMLDPAQVAFYKDWMREINRSKMGLSGRVTESDAERIAAQARAGVDQIFAKAFADAGYPVVTTPGPDVLRLSPQIINLYINAPDIPTAGRTRTYTVEAGQATLALEARDSETGAVLGRAIDRRIAGLGGPARITNSVSNRSDFSALFHDWAKLCVAGLARLKAAGA